MALVAPASVMMPSAAVARPATMGRPSMKDRMNSVLRGRSMRARNAARARRSASTSLTRHSPRWADPVACAISRIFSTIPSPVNRSGICTKGTDAAFSTAIVSLGPEPSAARTREGPRPSTPYARLLRERMRGIKARAVNGDDPRLETKRVKDFGHRATNRHDPAGIGDGDRAAGRILDGDAVGQGAVCRAEASGGDSKTESED